MKRRFSGEWLFPVLFLGILLVGYGLIPLPESREKTDSFAVSRGGKKIFFDLASRLLPDVRRSSGALIPRDAEADVLVLLGPARYPDRSQWETLHGWISEGRALIFAAKWEDPAVNLEPFGIEVVPAFASEGGAGLAMCLTAGSPTAGLEAGSPCLLPIGRPQVVPSEGWRCSAWRREVCNAVAMPEELYGNAAFRRAFDAYAADPCRFVADHRRLRDAPGAAPVLAADPPQSISLEAGGSGISVAYTTTFEADGDGTIVHVLGNYSLPNHLLARVADRLLLERAINRDIERANHSYRRLCESIIR